MFMWQLQGEEFEKTIRDECEREKAAVQEAQEKNVTHALTHEHCDYNIKSKSKIQLERN